MVSCRFTSKSILTLLSILFAAAAICLFAIGIYVFVTYNHYDEFINSRFTLVPASVVLAVGVVFLVASCFGCCSMAKDNKCLLVVFGAFLVILITLLVAAAACVFVYKQDINTSVHNQTEKAFEEYKKDENIRKQFDYVQQTLKCCGVVNFEDWSYQYNATYVPESCCVPAVNDTVGHCDGHMPPHGWDDSIYKEGCYQKIRDIFLDNLKYVAGAAVVFAVLLIIGFISTCALLCYKREAAAPYLSLPSAQ